MYTAAQTTSNTEVDEINGKKWNIQTVLNLPEWGGALRDHGVTVNRITAFRAKSPLVPYTPAEIQKHVHFEQNKQ